MKVKSEREINIIRAKVLVGDATTVERQDFLYYVSLLEFMLEEAGDKCKGLYMGKKWEDYMQDKFG